MIDWQNLITAGLSRMDDEPHTDVASDLADRVMDAYRAAEPWAVFHVESAVYEACRDALNKAHKATNSVTAITRAGRVRRITASASAKVRAADSGEIVGWQRSTVWSYGLAEIERYCDDLLRIGVEHRERQQAWFAVRDAVRKHPEMTAAQAWLAEGRSLAEIDLSA